jgi:predicted PurR-regulated permease PerM
VGMPGRSADEAGSMLTRDPWIRALVIVLLLIAGLYLAGLIWQVAVQFADIILLFFLAWVVAFILEPFVDGFERHARLPRAVAAVVFGAIAARRVTAPIRRGRSP